MLRWTCLIPALAAAAGLSLAEGSAAQLKRPGPAQPAGWKPGAEARAFAGGPARVVREFLWGQKLEPASGILRLKAVDNTWSEDPASEDILAEGVARVTVPSEKAEYYIRLIRLRPVGERRPTMGGVMVNGELFGNTGVGGPGLFPRLKAYVAVWGRANVVKDGRVIARDRPALAWIGQGPRDPNGKWLYEPDKAKVTAHLIVFGSLGAGSPIPDTPDGFLHFEWPAAKVMAPGFVFDPYSPVSAGAGGAGSPGPAPGSPR